MTEDKKLTFALYFGNRGFFPEKLMAGARREVDARVRELGYDTLMMAESATKYGAVEGTAEGLQYAEFLNEHRGRYDGVILCLPNFGDETGAIAGLMDCGVPILVHAYPDEKDKMGFADRRDAFCGKFSVMDVFYQYGLPFTTFPPHTVAPSSPTFAEHVRRFAAVCRIVRGMRRTIVGGIGARTTAFKTVRYDEIALQRYGITTETFDLSELFRRVRGMAEGDALKAKTARLKEYTNWNHVPEEKIEILARVGVVIDEMIDEYRLDAIALRCWLEMEQELGVSPCVILSELNDRGIAAACELDICNAVAMHALRLASEGPSTVLDWNNNYGDDPDRCILFHCGPVPQQLMTGKGQIVDHPMFAKALDEPGCAYGCNTGRIKPSPMTYCSAKTENGKLWFYLGEGEFTDDPIADDFFGCAGVARIPGLQDVLEFVGQQGYRHHVGVAFGHVGGAIREAFTKYLGYELRMM